MTGRPTKYKPEYDEEIIKYAKEGEAPANCLTVEKFADHFDVVVSTLYEWSHENPSFSKAFKRAMEIARNRFVDFGLNHLILNKESHFFEKTYNTILRNKFGYEDKTFVHLPHIAKAKGIVRKAEMVLESLLAGTISLEDTDRLMNIFKNAINVENEAELRPIVEQLQEELEARKKK